jgi:hypothetical protein
MVDKKSKRAIIKLSTQKHAGAGAKGVHTMTMKKIYVYTTVEGFEGSWDEALDRSKVEVIATIEGEDQRAVEKKAYELYGDSDTYGWTYSAEGISEAEEVEEIKV